MMEAAHRVMVLIESAESQGKPTLEQVEAAIVGDYEQERRQLEEVFSQRDMVALANGGNEAIDRGRKIFNLAEHYRLELIRVMQFASAQLAEAHRQTEDLSKQQTDLIKRIKALEDAAVEAGLE